MADRADAGAPTAYPFEYRTAARGYVTWERDGQDRIVKGRWRRETPEGVESDILRVGDRYVQECEVGEDGTAYIVDEWMELPPDTPEMVITYSEV